MRILELSLRNYRVFEQVDLELPARVIGIFGENGAGKSALMEAIEFCCYGGARTKKDQIRTHGVLTDCEVRLVFEHGGQQYEARRTVKGKNHQVDAELLVGGASLAVGVREVDEEVRRLLRMDRQVFRSSVFAEQKHLDAFSDLRKAGRKEMVLRLLGIRPVDEARTAARRAARETKADAERIAGALPDVSEQEAALEGARELLRKAGARGDEAAAALEAARGALAEAKEAFEASDRTRQEAEKLAGRIEAAQEQVRGLTARRDELAGRIGKLEGELAELPALEEEARALEPAGALVAAARTWAEADGELRAVREELDGLPEVDAAAIEAGLAEAEAALREAEAAAHRAGAAAERAAEDLRRAQADRGTAGDLDPTKPCPTCGQALGEAFRDVVAHREEEVRRSKADLAGARKAAEEAEERRERAAAVHEEAKRRTDRAREAVGRRAALERELSKVRARVERAAGPFEGRAPDLEELERRAARAEEVAGAVATLRAHAGHLAQARDDLAGAEADLTEATGRRATLTAERGELAFEPKEHETLRSRFREAEGSLEQARSEERTASDARKEAEKEVARLQADIDRVRETAARVGALRDEARYAERVALLLDGFRDHLVGRIGPELSREAEALFRDLTNHEYEDLRIDEEDLSIHIADGGTYFPIERFSGSETDLANLALRAAISVHLSRVSGADLGMMVLDEVLASLDAERKDLMVRAMGRLANRFHQLFVITHAEQVKDQFPAVIQVRKTARRRSEAVLA